MPMIIVRYVFPKSRPQLREQVAELARCASTRCWARTRTSPLVEEADPPSKGIQAKAGRGQAR